MDHFNWKIYWSSLVIPYELENIGDKSWRREFLMIWLLILS